MPYIGNIPAESYSQVSYQDLTGGSGTSFTLDYPVGSAGEIEVYINNVRQEPTVAYTVSGTALTMTGSVSATDDFYVVFQGKNQQSIGIPEKQTDGTYLFPGNIDITGTVTSDGLTADASGTPASFNRTDGNAALLELKTSGSVRGYIGADATGSTVFYSGAAAERLRIDNSGNVDLTAGGGNIKMANGAGIDFSATSNITGTSSELLDDYEEGTFTPHISDDSGGSTTAQAYGYNDGWYTKIGKLVYFHIDLRNINSSNLTGTNTLYITGLPFTSLTTSVGGQLAVSMVPGNALSWSGYTQLFPTIVNGTDYLIIRMSSSGTTSPATMLISNINGGTNRDMWLSGTYRID